MPRHPNTWTPGKPAIAACRPLENETCPRSGSAGRHSHSTKLLFAGHHDDGHLCWAVLLCETVGFRAANYDLPGYDEVSVHTTRFAKRSAAFSKLPIFRPNKTALL